LEVVHHPFASLRFRDGRCHGARVIEPGDSARRSCRTSGAPEQGHFGVMAISLLPSFCFFGLNLSLSAHYSSQARRATGARMLTRSAGVTIAEVRRWASRMRWRPRFVRLSMAVVQSRAVVSGSAPSIRLDREPMFHISRSTPGDSTAKPLFAAAWLA